MGKTRDLFKKMRDTKGTFHAKMDTIMGRNGMDLTEAEDTKKRWQEYTELYIKEKVGELASLKLKNFCFAKDNVKKISHRQRENVQIHI